MNIVGIDKLISFNSKKEKKEKAYNGYSFLSFFKYYYFLNRHQIACSSYLSCFQREGNRDVRVFIS